jgi:hypothetical protein
MRAFHPDATPDRHERLSSSSLMIEPRTVKEIIMERVEMIRRIVDASIDIALRERDFAWLRTILSDGFPGYGRLTDAGLAREMRLRGLLEFDEPELDVDFDDDPDPDDDEDLDEAVRCVMLSGMVVVEAVDAGALDSSAGARSKYVHEMIQR